MALKAARGGEARETDNICSGQDSRAVSAPGTAVRTRIKATRFKVALTTETRERHGAGTSGALS